jgi:DNA-binding NarL/FixJ family response regulator
VRNIRVLIADDHALVRAGIRALLEEFAGIEVVAEAADGRAAVGLTGERAPDVVLMDITMPDLNGLEAAARIVKQYPTTRVLVVSMHTDEVFVARALAAGATGYVIKGASESELEVAVRSVAGGQRYLSPAISQDLVSEYLRRGATERAAVDGLSPRQREVLQLIAEGRSTRAIAERLGVSVKTVESHRLQLIRRLGIRDVPGLVRIATLAGLVSLD